MTRLSKGMVLLALCTSAFLLFLTSCPGSAKKQLYFDDLKAPVGVGKVTVVKDTSMNLPTGGEITVLAVVEPNVDKDELLNLMKSFYRQVSKRRGFQKGGRPEKIEMRFYTTKNAAQAGGSDWLAQTLRISSVSKPTYTNRQKPPLLKWAQKALAPNMPIFTGKLKPQFLANPDQMTLDITWPFVSDDGKGQYVEKLSHEKATTEFSSVTIVLFEKIPLLKKLTFRGKHNDTIVMKVMMTRDQFTELNIKNVEELLGAYQGSFFKDLLGKRINEKQLHRKVLKRRKKVYRETFARLPKEQVELAKDLR